MIFGWWSSMVTLDDDFGWVFWMLTIVCLDDGLRWYFLMMILDADFGWCCWMMILGCCYSIILDDALGRWFWIVLLEGEFLNDGFWSYVCVVILDVAFGWRFWMMVFGWWLLMIAFADAFKCLFWFLIFDDDCWMRASDDKFKWWLWMLIFDGDVGWWFLDDLLMLILDGHFW